MSSGISRTCALAMLAVAASSAPLPAAAAVDWAKAPSKDITLFYPAQISWDRLFTPRRHSGQLRYPQKTCVGCHGGIDEAPIGGSLVTAEQDKEPSPIPGKPPVVMAKIKAAHDNDTLFVRIEFVPGVQPDAAMDKDFETKVTMMLDDGGVKEARTAGCWITCHGNVESMRYSQEGTTKFLLETRRPDSITTLKSDDELAALRAAGNYLEYWQARVNPGQPAVAVDGTVFEKRVAHETPAVAATASVTKGVYTVTLSRKLKAGGPYKDLAPGKVYTVGFAIHAGHTARRFHYVSFERTLVLDGAKGEADILAPALPAK